MAMTHQYYGRILTLAAALGLILTVIPAARGDITAEEVRESIKRAVDYLKSQQDKGRGNWTEYTAGVAQPGGVTALCTLAMLNAGVEVKDPAIQKALSYLRNKLDPPKTTYAA